MLDDILDGFEAHIVTVRLRREKQERAEAERRELERRRGLAKARRDRDNERKRLLNRLILTTRQVAQLRDLIGSYEQVEMSNTNGDLDRMIHWMRAQLSALEASLDPDNLAKELGTRKLFPEVDELVDPLGEPPQEQHWY